MNDDQLINEVLDRAMKSDLFCIRMITACKDFIKKLEENE